MNRFIAFLAVAISLAVLTGAAQAQTDEKSRSVRAETQTVQTRRVSAKPKSANIPTIVATSQARRLPQWARSGSSSNNASMTLAAAPKGQLKKVTLTVRNNYTPLAHLSFREAAVSAKENNASWSKNIQNIAYGYVSAGFQVEAGKRYLLDYDVNARQNMSFGVKAGNNGQDIVVSAGRQSLLIYLDATETAEVITLLNSDKANYVFHSLTITRVD